MKYLSILILIFGLSCISTAGESPLPKKHTLPTSVNKKSGSCHKPSLPGSVQNKRTCPGVGTSCGARIALPVVRCRLNIAPQPFKKWNLSLYAGRGPEGWDRILYKSRRGFPEYQGFKNYGDVLGVSGSYRFTETFNATVIYITNETYLGGVGIDF